MAREHLQREPHKAKAKAMPAETCEAWWYEELGRIDIYLRINGKTTARVQIARNSVEAWLRRVNKAAPGGGEGK